MKNGAFGFDEIEKDLNNILTRAEKLDNEMENLAEKIKNKSVINAKSKGLMKSGKGIKGIVKQKNEEGWAIGWAERPNLHLFFHETGWHTGKPKSSKTQQKNGVRRTVRTYKKTAKFIKATPHMRPAFDELAPKGIEKIKNLIEKG